MNVTRDFEQERDCLLRQIEAALPHETIEVLKTASLLSLEPKILLTNNEVGSEYATDTR